MEKSKRTLAARRKTSRSHILTDHDEIREWAEERGANPARIKTAGNGNASYRTAATEAIRIDFPGFTGKNTLDQISWDEFFEEFENHNLALLVQEENAAGERSNFNRLIKRSAAGKKAA